MRNLFVKAVLVSVVLFLGTKVFAKENKTLPEPREVTVKNELKPHIGIIYGLVMPEGHYESDDVVGIDVGYQPFIPFGLGLEFVTTHLTDDDYTVRLNRNDLTAKVTYNFGGTTPLIKNSYVGLGLGASFGEDSTNWVTVPVIGFDIPLEHQVANYFSLGGAVKYSIYEGSQTDTVIVSGALKYWF